MMELGRIVITRFLDEEGNDVSDLEVYDDAEHLLTALGMLELAKDSLLHGPNVSDDDDRDDLDPDL